MINWWNNLTSLQQLFATVAIPATIVMLIQTVLFFFGLMDGDGDSDISGGHHADFHTGGSHGISHSGFHSGAHDGSGDTAGNGLHNSGNMDHGDAEALRLFTIRGLVAFFSVGGWMGLVACKWSISTPFAITLALAAGFAALYFVAWALKAAVKLQSSGNIQLSNAIGKKGEVYMPIPASNGGPGKISIIVQERLCEFDAITEADRTIKTGEPVIVTAVAREGVLLVEPEEISSFNFR